MQSFFATFGGGHEYAGYYVEIVAADEAEAQDVMRKAHCDRWASMYGKQEFMPMILKYGLQKLAKITMARDGYFRAEHPTREAMVFGR